MKTKHTLTFALLAAALTVTLATSGLMAGKPPKPPPPELPPLHYRISFPQLPESTTAGGMSINDINNSGDVVGLSLPEPQFEE